MDIITEKSSFFGSLTPPQFKSYAIRNLIALSLSDQTLNTDDFYDSEDIIAAKSFYNCVKNGDLQSIDANESATVFRLCFPIVSALGGGRINARKTLLARPHDEFANMGIEYNITDNGIEIQPGLKPGKFYIRGDVSSQFISGLLFALPLLGDDSEIILTTPLKSGEYVECTLDVLNNFGINIIKTSNGFYIGANQKYVLKKLNSPTDISLGSYFLALGLFGGEVSINGDFSDSIQPDVKCIDILQKMNGDVKIEKNKIIARKSRLIAANADISDFPDSAPLIAACMALASGTSKIFGIERLKYKESNRANAIENVINSLGGCAKILGDHIEITGGSLRAGTVESFGDHRIVMMAAVLGGMCSVKIMHAHSVCKSFPDFFVEYINLGGKYERI